MKDIIPKNQAPIIGQIADQIARLKSGEAVTLGGPSDIRYVQGQIDKARKENPSLGSTLDELEAELRTVDPELSTWESRSKRQTLPDPAIAASTTLIQGRIDALVFRGPQTTRDEYENKYGVETSVVDLLGVDKLRRATVINSNYGGSGPFITMLNSADDLSDGDAEALIGLGFNAYELKGEELLALFIDNRRVRKTAKLTREKRYLDKEAHDFILNQSGNYGTMYFVGPLSANSSELEKTLSPVTVLFFRHMEVSQETL